MININENLVFICVDLWLKIESHFVRLLNCFFFASFRVIRGQILFMKRFSILIIPILICLSFALSVSAQTVLKIDGAGLRKLLPNKENKKPVLINFWATWCGPCRVEFPELVEIDKDFRAKGLNVKLVSVDNFALIDTLVPEFLQQYEAAQIPAFLLDIPSDFQRLRAIRRIAPTVKKGIPLTLLYNANGKLVYRKSGVIDAAILRARIEKTLDK